MHDRCLLVLAKELAGGGVSLKATGPALRRKPTQPLVLDRTEIMRGITES